MLCNGILYALLMAMNKHLTLTCDEQKSLHVFMVNEPDVCSAFLPPLHPVSAQSLSVETHCSM